MTFCPAETGTPKLHIPAPPFSAPHTIRSITWLSNPTFYTIYASLPDADPTHVAVTLDGKSNSTENVKFAPPNFLLAGSTPSAFTLAMRNWDPAKLILVVGDSASPDLGIIGHLDGKWCNIYLEETDTPRMPLDENGDETVIAALELDLTNDQPLNVKIDGEDLQVPPPPIMYVYTSDGTVQGWNVVNARGVQYPGIVNPPICPQPSVLAFPSDTEPSPEKIAGPNVQVSAEPDLSPSRDTATREEPQRTSGQRSILASDLRSNVTVGNLVPALGRSSTSDQQAALMGLTLEGQRSSPIIGQPSFGQPSALNESLAFDENTTSTPSTGVVPFDAFAPAIFTPSIDHRSTLSPAVQMLSQASSEDTSPDAGSPSLESLSLGDHPRDMPRNSRFAKPLAMTQPRDIQAEKFSTGTWETGPAVFGGISVPDEPVNLSNSSSPDSSPCSRPSSPLGPETSGNLPFASTFKNSVSLRMRESSEPRISNSGSQPASGFGAFGNDSKLASSPFANPKHPSSKPARATDPPVNASMFGGQSGSGNAGSVFGAPSALGGIKSMFGSIGSSATVQSGASSGGFGAYSGTSSGFGVLAGQRKPFGELLKESDTPQPQASQNTLLPLLPPRSNENSKYRRFHILHHAY
jgi:nucleoporin NUP159